MATIGRLVTETRKAFGRPVRLWLTELGYQSNPPDKLAGVAPAVPGVVHRGRRVQGLGDPARRSADPVPLSRRARPRPLAERSRDGRWRGQAGHGRRARAASAEVSRSAAMTSVWGAVRAGDGPQPYRLQRWNGKGWSTIPVASPGHGPTARSSAPCKWDRASSCACLRVARRATPSSSARPPYATPSRRGRRRRARTRRRRTAGERDAREGRRRRGRRW